jgi:hypothetical protein
LPDVPSKNLIYRQLFLHGEGAASAERRVQSTKLLFNTTKLLKTRQCYFFQLVAWQALIFCQREKNMNQLSWKNAYKDAVLETDDALIPLRIEAARKAIHARLRQRLDPLSKREFDDMEGALRTLSFLVRQAA